MSDRDRRRVVVTGLGVLSPLGTDLATTWDNTLSGKSGIKTITHFDTTGYATNFAGMVPDFDVNKFMSPKDARKCDLFIQYGIAAGIMAVTDSGLDVTTDLNLDKVGVIIGSGIGGIGTIEEQKQKLLTDGPKRISPFFIPASIINLISGHLSIKYGFRGVNLAVATACTTGTHAIGMAMRSIIYGDADVVVAGGAEKASTPLGMGGFAAARALSTKNSAPELASRPWDKDRDGFVLGDGSGVLVLEEYEHAKNRGAKMYAELVGFGMSGDAFHITRPSGDGACLAMRNALKDANLNPGDIDYINAHATSTQAGDVGESLAIKQVLGENAAAKVSVSSTKSMMGHLLGAAGAVEAILTVMALKHQVAPPTINLDNPDVDCDLDYVAHQAKERRIRAAISNSFGFGGTNGTLVFEEI